MNKYFRGFLVVLLLMPFVCNASSYTGKTTTIRYGGGFKRISVQTGAHSSPCLPIWSSWFSFEGATASDVELWASALLRAQSEGRTVVIQGTGSCDSAGVESISFIDIK
jgi:hypothetical protein